MNDHPAAAFLMAGLACIAALALWKETKQRWGFTMIGMFVVAATMKYAFAAYDADDFISGWLIFMVGNAVLTAGAYGLRRLDKWRAPKATAPDPLWCIDGGNGNGHVMSVNEPYRLTRDGNIVCLDCIQRNRARMDRQRQKGFEWALLPAAERYHRASVARAKKVCPVCAESRPADAEGPDFLCAMCYEPEYYLDYAQHLQGSR